MKATPSGIQKYLGTVSETPQRIALLVKGLDDACLQLRADPKSWSANDILAHLRSCADLWTHSMYAMLAEKEPVFSDIDEWKWAKVTRYSELPFHKSLQIFSLQRENLVGVLEVLPFEAWERSAVILERRHTVFTQARRLAKHEKEHLEQLKVVLGENRK